MGMSLSMGRRAKRRVLVLSCVVERRREGWMSSLFLVSVDLYLMVQVNTYHLLFLLLLTSDVFRYVSISIYLIISILAAADYHLIALCGDGLYGYQTECDCDISGWLLRCEVINLKGCFWISTCIIPWLPAFAFEHGDLIFQSFEHIQFKSVWKSEHDRYSLSRKLPVYDYLLIIILAIKERAVLPKKPR